MAVSATPMANFAPKFAAPTAAFSVDENTAGGHGGGHGVDGDRRSTATTLSYSLFHTDASLFTVDSTSGQIRTKAALDFEEPDRRRHQRRL